MSVKAQVTICPYINFVEKSILTRLLIIIIRVIIILEVLR